MAASWIASRSPTSVMTQRLWSESISRSRRCTPSSFMASTRASTLDLSRPSEKFGTHSTRVCISEKHSWGARGLQAQVFNRGDHRGRREEGADPPKNLRARARSLRLHQQAPSVGNEIADLERFHQKWHMVLLKEGADFSFCETGK